MKVGKSIAILAGLAFGLSLSAFAKDKNETRVTFSEPVQIGSTQLQAGDYKLQWDGNGPDVQVKVIKGKDIQATAPAKLVANNPSLGNNAVTTGSNSTTKTLDEVDFDGGRQSLKFTSSSAMQASGGQQ